MWVVVKEVRWVVKEGIVGMDVEEEEVVVRVVVVVWV